MRPIHTAPPARADAIDADVDATRADSADAIDLSIVIPVLDEARALPGLLRRLPAQIPGEATVEILVVDGGSTDGTPDLVQPPARLVRSEPGRGTQLNRGVNAAEGAALLVLHADARLADGAIPAALDALRSGVGYGTFHQTIRGRHPLYRSIERWANLRGRATGLVYGDSGLFCRSDLLADVGGFPDWPIFEDAAVSQRMRRRARWRVLDERVWVSPRRWERGGILQTTLTSILLQARFYAGADPRRLQGWAPLGR